MTHRRERRRELPVAIEREERALSDLRLRQEASERHGPVGEEARREREVARQVLAERAEPAILAARLSPPDYIRDELGERPSDPQKARAWDEGVRAIETYRSEYGVTDATSALERKPGDRSSDAAHERARRAVREAQSRLDRQYLDRTMERGQEAETDLGMDFGL